MLWYELLLQATLKQAVEKAFNLTVDVGSKKCSVKDEKSLNESLLVGRNINTLDRSVGPVCMFKPRNYPPYLWRTTLIGNISLCYCGMQSCGNLERHQLSSVVDIPHENCQEITAIIREQRYSFIRTGDENLKAKQPVWHMPYMFLAVLPRKNLPYICC